MTTGGASGQRRSGGRSRQAPPAERIVAEPVIAAIAADTARDTPGVVRLEPGVAGLLRQFTGAARRLAGVRQAPVSDGVEVLTEDGRTTIRIDLVVSIDRKVATTALDVQQRVAEAVTTNTGIADPVVAVSVVDIRVPRTAGW